jgi:pyridoxal phosphate enzyme (YggS family)
MFEQSLQRVTDRIGEACIRYSRARDEVRLLAVTKNHARDAVEQALAAGLTLFGENRVQEAVDKYSGLTGGFELHLIGHLQSNKAKNVPGLFTCVESIDSVRTARAISTRLDRDAPGIDVLLQFNSTGESTKSGFTSAEQLLDSAHEICTMPGVTVRGVMTIGPFTTDTSHVQRAFRTTRAVYERLSAEMPPGTITVLSMGMTDDMDIAIGEGSTEVRVGTALFGSRS